MIAIISILIINTINFLTRPYDFAFKLNSEIPVLISYLFFFLIRKSIRYKEKDDIDKKNQINISVSSVCIFICAILLFVIFITS